MNKERIKIAIQKSGRLTSYSFSYLKSLGLKFDDKSDELIIPCDNYPIDILMVRNSDIGSLVEDSIADFGITGENLIVEKTRNIKTLSNLNFAICSLIIASPKKSKILSVSDLNGLNIATSYPNTLRKYLTRNNIKADIVTMDGSVEIAPQLGLANAVCDITESGSTLRKNNLKIIETVLKSQAVLITSKKYSPKNYIFTNLLISKYENILV